MMEIARAKGPVSTPPKELRNGRRAGLSEGGAAARDRRPPDDGRDHGCSPAARTGLHQPYWKRAHTAGRRTINNSFIRQPSDETIRRCIATDALSPQPPPNRPSTGDSQPFSL